MDASDNLCCLGSFSVVELTRRFFFLACIINHYQTRNLNWWQIKIWRTDLHSVWQIIRNMKDLKSLSTVSESFWHSCHCCLFKAMIRNRIINLLYLYQTEVSVRHWCNNMHPVLSFSDFWNFGSMVQLIFHWSSEYIF